MSPIRTLAAAMAVGAFLLVSAAPAVAANAPSDPNRQTPWGLYLTAKEAYEMKRARPDGVLLVDVRDPIEIMFTGFTDMADINISFLLANPRRWNDKTSTYALERNPDFARDIEAALLAKGLDKSDPVIIMCRSGGARGAPSANMLHAPGFKQVYVVVDGFQGATVNDHPNGPLRLKNGWQNSGLPWGWRLNREKMHIRTD